MKIGGEEGATPTEPAHMALSTSSDGARIRWRRASSNRFKDFLNNRNV